MPRTTESFSQRITEEKVCEKAEFIRKRYAILSVFDKFFYSFAFCLLLISPVNAADSVSVKSTQQTTDIFNDTGINLFAAYVTEDLQTSCQANTAITCKLNALSQAALLASLYEADTSRKVISALKGSEYELLIGSTTITDNTNNKVIQELRLEVSAQWRGIILNDVQLSVILDNNITNTTEQIATASNQLLSQWIESAANKQVFSAEYLYQFLGASDYANELKVPFKIGDFNFSRQHLFNDPLKGMLTRYIHKDFALAVFDVYVYPLKTSHSAEIQSQNELLLEQQDILAISKALGNDALTMSDIYELESIAGLQDTRIFAFEATLQVNSEPLFTTQYVYVKNDKVVKFSINAPPRITNNLIAEAINAIAVPSESSLMKQVRQANVHQHRTNPVSAAP
ncbi:MAG: hypothetical protein ACI9IT_001897 [Glaciecola sp.]|jgi:hypothetical protein